MNDPFTKVSHRIPLDEAVALTTRYRQERPGMLVPDWQGENTLPTCETFGKQSVEDLINQYDCEGLRIYYGMDENLKMHAVLVAVGPDGDDLLPLQQLDDEEYFLLQRAERCPVDCPRPSVLNN